MANYRGADGIEFVSHGVQSDPELIYDRKSFNYWDIDNSLWDEFCEIVSENTGKSIMEIDSNMNDYEDDFNLFVRDNAVNYLEDCIFGGYDYKIVKDQ